MELKNAVIDLDWIPVEDLIAFLRARLDDYQRHIAKLRELTAEDQGWLQSDEELPPEPDRPMIDLDAKRRIIDWYEEHKPPYGSADQQVIYEDAEIVIQLLALPFADHPDYREGWRP